MKADLRNNALVWVWVRRVRRRYKVYRRTGELRQISLAERQGGGCKACPLVASPLRARNGLISSPRSIDSKLSHLTTAAFHLSTVSGLMFLTTLVQQCF